MTVGPGGSIVSVSVTFVFVYENSGQVYGKPLKLQLLTLIVSHYTLNSSFQFILFICLQFYEDTLLN